MSKKSVRAVGAGAKRPPGRGGVARPSVTLVPVAKLNPAPYNPRKISGAMLASLKDNIRAHGLLQPVVVQRRGRVVIGGHQRLRALREIAAEDGTDVADVPCILVDVGDREAKKLNLALNKIGGDWDARLLGSLFVDLQHEAALTQDELSLTGFDADEVLKYARLVEPVSVPPPDELNGFASSVTLSLEFTDTRLRDAVRRVLRERVGVAKRTSGELVADALGIRLEA
jgi:hypothetical protein